MVDPTTRSSVLSRALGGIAGAALGLIASATLTFLFDWTGWWTVAIPVACGVIGALSPERGVRLLLRFIGNT